MVAGSPPALSMINPFSIWSVGTSTPVPAPQVPELDQLNVIADSLPSLFRRGIASPFASVPGKSPEAPFGFFKKAGGRMPIPLFVQPVGGAPWAPPPMKLTATPLFVAG